MSTRSAIIMKTNDGYAGVYCHSDGYMEAPHGVGHKLLTYYTDIKKVAKLIALGDLSSLGERVAPLANHHSFEHAEDGTTVAYGRDRGEGVTSDNVFTVGDTVEDVESKIGHNGFVYVFEDGKWSCNGKVMDGQSKFSKEDIDQMRYFLAERDIEQSDDSTLISVFLEGCEGWENFSDDDVVVEYLEYRPEVTPEGGIESLVD